MPVALYPMRVAVISFKFRNPHWDGPTFLWMTPLLTFLIFFPAPEPAFRSLPALLVLTYSQPNVSLRQAVAAGNDIPHKIKTFNEPSTWSHTSKAVVF